MPTVYETEFWRVRLPEGWAVREADGQALVEIRKAAGGVGVLGLVTTHDEPKDWWCRRGELFHGQLYGKMGEDRSKEFDSFSRWWTLLCGNVTVYISYYCVESAGDLEREDVDAIVQSLLPRSFDQQFRPLFDGEIPGR